MSGLQQFEVLVQLGAVSDHAFVIHETFGVDMLFEQLIPQVVFHGWALGLYIVSELVGTGEQGSEEQHSEEEKRNLSGH